MNCVGVLIIGWKLTWLSDRCFFESNLGDVDVGLLKCCCCCCNKEFEAANEDAMASIEDKPKISAIENLLPESFFNLESSNFLLTGLVFILGELGDDCWVELDEDEEDDRQGDDAVELLLFEGHFLC